MQAILPLLIPLLGVGKEPAPAPKVPKVETAPVVDGTGNDPAWAKACRMPLKYTGEENTVPFGGSVRLCRTEKRLFMLFHCPEPSQSHLENLGTQEGLPVLMDDLVGAAFTANRHEPETFYLIMANASGAVSERFYVNAAAKALPTKAVSKVKVGTGGWSVELTVPFVSLDRIPVAGDTWLGNFGRARFLRKAQVISWKPFPSFFDFAASFKPFAIPKVASVSKFRKVTRRLLKRRTTALSERLQSLTSRLPLKTGSSDTRAARKLLNKLRKNLVPAENFDKWCARLANAGQRIPEAETAVNRARLARGERKPYGVSVVSSMTKLRPDQVPEHNGNPQVSLNAARGEGESAQVVITAVEGLSEVTAGATALSGPHSASIKPSVRLVGYVPVREPTPGGFMEPGRYPDPLLELKPFNVKAGTSRSLWITVNVPRKVPPGKYTGTLTIEPEGGVASSQVPVTVKVAEVTLPVRSKLKTRMGFPESRCRAAYGDTWTTERHKEFMKKCLKRYRFTAPPALPWNTVFRKNGEGTWTADWSTFDQAVIRWLRRGSTAFHITSSIMRGYSLPRKRAEAASKLALLDEHLRKRGWSKRFFFYLFDEPPVQRTEAAKRVCDFIHKHGPRLQVILTANIPHYRAYAGSINLWCPDITVFDEAFMAERRAAGEQVWMYVCISTAATPYPDIWRIDRTGTSHRAIGWWLWRYGCQGFLYWTINYWERDGKVLDLYSDPRGYPGGNGEGYLFYPARDRKAEPVPSMRVEIFRDAIEDYDLLSMLRESVRKLSSSEEKTAAAREAASLLNASDIIPAKDRFCKDPAALEGRHEAILKALESLR